ncbi:hypothetical protein EVJ58_g10675 [Rhodofomes roseus]|uniref:BTB domain-containing protein n=1 Tax=Rhodofomes roseus TaxID=34475 RepID=A0A4Y9XPC8_9APHY|nr:hypothetical protein EVJ58_g10675 [Rhodofomes roseus]
MASPTEYKVAGDPFNKPNADVILRSLDGVHFYVHWVVLGLTSGFFEDMEKMPQPAGGSERAIIPVQEDSATLDALLRFMYPGGDKPAIDDIMRIGDVLCAAVKYQVDDVVKYLKRQLSLFDDPLRVFIVGCLADLEDVAYQAAIEWCQENAFDLEDTYVPEMTVLPSATYFRLLHFCDALNRGGEISENYSFTRPPSVLASSAPEPTATFTVTSPFNRPSAHANIIIRSNDKVDFYVNEGILALASSKLESLLHDAPDSSPRSHDGYRVLALPEDANILLPLLQLTYPVVSPHIRDWELLTHVLLTAYKYELVRAAELAKRAWVKEIPTEPLRSYFIAVQQGWKEEAKRAARHAVLLPADEYCPEMELVPASCYDRFLRYRQKCRRNVISARRAFMDDVYLHAAVDQQEVYDTFWHAHDVSTMFHYSLHATWARAGATSPGQLMSCLHTWNGRHGDILELIHNYDKYGGQAMDAVDQLAFEV